MAAPPHRVFPRRFAVLPALLLAALCVMPVRAEDARERADRLDALIEALNAGSFRRAYALEDIFTELRGPAAREMHEMLRGALSRQNTLILQGVIEALAMLGDPRDVPALGTLLSTSHTLEVKLLAIRLLPAFCLPTERARLDYVKFAAGNERFPRPGVLEALRRPPLTRRGRLDFELERLQTRVIRMLAAQFDPVGAALEYIDDGGRREAVRLAVEHFVGGALGEDPSRWAGIWAVQGGGTESRVPDEIEEIRLAVLASLADMGAEGLPEIVAPLEQAFGAGGDVLPQAAFETARAMCRNAFDWHSALTVMQFSPEERAEAEKWRDRRYASAVRLAVRVVDAASGFLSPETAASVFDAAVSALGAALSHPADFPDPDGALAAALDRGLTRLERILPQSDLGRERRSAILLALGEVGTSRAIAVIADALDSPYASAEYGNDGMRFAESAVDALRNAAVGGGEGRDEARRIFLNLLADGRVYPPSRPGTPPVGMAHMALWRLQRLGRSNDIVFDPDVWRERLGW